MITDRDVQRYLDKNRDIRRYLDRYGYKHLPELKGSRPIGFVAYFSIRGVDGAVRYMVVYRAIRKGSNKSFRVDAIFTHEAFNEVVDTKGILQISNPPIVRTE